MNVRDSHVRKMAFLIIVGALGVIQGIEEKISEIPGNIRLQIEAQHIPKSCHPLNICMMSKDTPLATLNNEADKLNNANDDK